MCGAPGARSAHPIFQAAALSCIVFTVRSQRDIGFITGCGEVGEKRAWEKEQHVDTGADAPTTNRGVPLHRASTLFDNKVGIKVLIQAIVFPDQLGRKDNGGYPNLIFFCFSQPCSLALLLLRLRDSAPMSDRGVFGR